MTHAITPEGFTRHEATGYQWGQRKQRQPLPNAAKAYMRTVAPHGTLAEKLEAEKGFVRGAVCASVTRQVLEQLPCQRP